jgi:hypothetical protein
MSRLYQSLSHSKWDCKYDVVLVSKRRRKIIFGQTVAKSVIKPLDEDHTPGPVKPVQVALVEPVACSLSQTRPRRIITFSSSRVLNDDDGYVVGCPRSQSAFQQVLRPARNRKIAL